MKMILRVWIVVCFAVLMAGAAHATMVINFDDISPYIDLTTTSYGGLTWGTSSNDIPGRIGYWGTSVVRHK